MQPLGKTAHRRLLATGLWCHLEERFLIRCVYCFSGSCVFDNGAASCKCSPRFTGDRCNMDYCNCTCSPVEGGCPCARPTAEQCPCQNQCKNGGTCFVVKDIAVCQYVPSILRLNVRCLRSPRLVGGKSTTQIFSLRLFKVVPVW